MYPTVFHGRLQGLKKNWEPNHVAFKKPVDGEAPVGYGFPQFVSHNDLRKRLFLVDDTLFIKVQVDSP